MKRTLAITALTGAGVLGLAACGGSSSPAPTAGTQTSAAQPSSTASTTARGGRGAGNRAALQQLGTELPQIRTCLTQANLPTTDLPTAIPTFAPRASGEARPSFNPSDRPTDRPSGGFGAGGGRFGGLFTILSNAQDQAALKACGITVPTLGGGFGPGAPGGQGGYAGGGGYGGGAPGALTATPSPATTT